MRRLLFYPISVLLATAVGVTTAGPAWAQDPMIGVSATCPDGLRVVQDPQSEAPELSCTNLTEADLMGAELYEADLTNANLSRAELQWADLRDADLSGADLTFTRLKWADLSGADLCGADLYDVDFQDVDLTGAVYDSGTRFPPGFNPILVGMRVVD